MWQSENLSSSWEGTVPPGSTCTLTALGHLAWQEEEGQGQ